VEVTARSKERQDVSNPVARLVSLCHRQLMADLIHSNIFQVSIELRDLLRGFLLI
jgi:uncharacterized protein (DUF488 family)